MQDDEDIMVSGKPPRRSKTANEPVTIDLEAHESAPAAAFEEAVEHPASPDPEVVAAEKAAFPAESEGEPLTEHESERATDAHENVPPPPQADTPPRRSVHEPVQSRQTSTSTLIAAGIVGGLVALLGAGSIQYAGLLPGTATRAENEETAALSAEIDGVKQAVANLAADDADQPPAQPDEALLARIATLEAEVAKNTSAAASGTTNAAADQKIADLTGQIQQLQASVDKLTQSQASNDADVTKRLDDAERKLNEPREDVAVAKAIAAAALKAAIDRGGPFLPELDTFAGVAPDDPAVADLRSFAATGVPSRAELIGEAPDVATAIVDAANQPPPDQSWTERLVAGAKSLVKVRPVGNVEGDTVEAVAARMEDKLKAGDLQGAAAEWNNLPEAGKTASAAFKQSLDARIRVEDLVAGALSKAVSGTGKQG
ncbi:mitofilin family membrane protein [Rhizobium sp. BK251]|uniref:COG4223 family protein n=1 Tax=Rhizobium sp. BK251 TaxID=2512125 RepID=UPI0010E73CA2|nr:mitofilin family membrane protein [Rhizobium sp. BK251]TCL72774.1 hypothetical protein EV286_104198 [Rhizobium sp. BK251]